MNNDSKPSERATISKEQIASDLRRMGIRKGDHVAVTLSFKAVGNVNGGPNAFIDCLLDAVGPEGTITMNSYTPSYPIAEIALDYVFDPKSSVPYTGIVPRTLLSRKGVVRSRHPTCSVASIGKLAHYLADDHDEKAAPFLPYLRLSHANGKYLCIGLKDRLVAVRHEAQRRAGFLLIPMFTGVRYKNTEGETKLFIQLNSPCARNLPKLVPRLRTKGIIKGGKIGLAESNVANAAALIEAMSSMLKEDPTLNLCDDIFCLRCRETEKRLNLYSRIENPHFFQKSKFMRKVLGWRNSFVLGRYSHISFSNDSTHKRPITPDAFFDIVLRRIGWFFQVHSRLIVTTVL